MTSKLIIAESEKDSNMFYATGMLVPDDFVYLESGNKKMIYIDDLEFNRAEKEAEVDKVINYSKYGSSVDRDSFGDILINILKDNEIKKVQIPGNFKMKYAKVLLDNKIEIETIDPLFKKREFKNEDEIKKRSKTKLSKQDINF
ncbi:MAG: hypothetical protein KAI71_06630 [Candidatus Pacebacteria bacterium]|nr:hypothetical protein [Candidatus Paceibacterota bacterium]